jgi:tRNA acetyltransferase TAN1
MNNFNLLISSPRYNEVNATAEMWFTLLICGEKYPVISTLDYPGLITASIGLSHREVIPKIKEILRFNPNFFKFVLKIIPIDFVCETNLVLIKELVENHYYNFIYEGESIRIDLKRRKSQTIAREALIKTIANIFTNKVDLNTPDKIIRFEIMGNITGISFLEPQNIISIAAKT